MRFRWILQGKGVNTTVLTGQDSNNSAQISRYFKDLGLGTQAGVNSRPNKCFNVEHWGSPFVKKFFSKLLLMKDQRNNACDETELSVSNSLSALQASHTNNIFSRLREATTEPLLTQQAALSWHPTVSPQLMAQWTFGVARPKTMSFPRFDPPSTLHGLSGIGRLLAATFRTSILLQLPHRQSGHTGPDSIDSRKADVAKECARDLARHGVQYGQ